MSAGDEAARELMLGFQSLGMNCEFGLVQRHFGAEPLGLLRWVHIDYDQLLAALDLRLAGVGEPEFTELFAPDWAEDYYTIDTRFYMRNHTFVRLDSGPPPEGFWEQRLRQLRYLRDRLLADLAEGHKINVLLSRADPVDAAMTARLAEALGRFGPNKLLVVQAATPEHPAGELLPVGETAVMARLSRLVQLFGPEQPQLEEWLALCRLMRERWPDAAD